MSTKESVNKAISKPSTPKTLEGMKAKDIGTFIIKNYGALLAQAAPKHISAERLIQVAGTVISRNPKLAKCTVPTLLGGVLNASILGLELTPQLGQAYLVPFKNNKTGNYEATFMIGFKGYLKLAWQSDMIKSISAHEVYECDDFEYQLGTDPYLKHIPGNPDEQSLKNIIGAYATVEFTNGGKTFVYLPKKEVMKRKNKSKGANSEFSPWLTEPEAMYRKSAIRALSTYLPLSTTKDFTAWTTDEHKVDLEAFREGEVDINTLEEPEYEEAETKEGNND
jgi:recombination protein RecT